MLFLFSVSTTLKRLIIILSFLLILTACSSGNQQPISFTTLPPGDASRGAQLFTQSVNGAPACTTCHRTDDTTLIGPGMKGFGARAGSRVPGESAAEYAVQSIARPGSFVVPGFSNVMYNEFATKLAPQDIADLVAYLLTL